MTELIRIDLGVLLPDAADACDTCTRRLTEELTAAGGVERVHVVPGDGRDAQVCVHYDPSQVDLPRIRRIDERAGARITGRYGHVLWEAEGLGHQRHARTVADRLRRMPGVVEAEADANGPIRIEFDREGTEEGTLRKHIRKLGASVTREQPTAAEVPPHDHGAHDLAEGDAHDHGEEDAHDGEPHDHGHGGVFGRATELVFSIPAGAATLGGFLDALRARKVLGRLGARARLVRASTGHTRSQLPRKEARRKAFCEQGKEFAAK